MLTPPAALEALLFAAGGPLEKKRLATLLNLSSAELATALGALLVSLQERGVRLVETQSEVELRTAPEAAGIVKALRESELSRDLGKASIETLAVIAYKDGGATRGEVDWVRGVSSSASLRTLLIRGLIERGEDPGDRRKVRYSLTPDALAHLGVSRVSDLPRHEELARGAVAAIEEEAAAEAAEAA